MNCDVFMYLIFSMSAGVVFTPHCSSTSVCCSYYLLLVLHAFITGCRLVLSWRWLTTCLCWNGLLTTIRSLVPHSRSSPIGPKKALSLSKDSEALEVSHSHFNICQLAWICGKKDNEKIVYAAVNLDNCKIQYMGLDFRRRNHWMYALFAPKTLLGSLNYLCIYGKSFTNLSFLIYQPLHHKCCIYGSLNFYLLFCFSGILRYNVDFQELEAFEEEFHDFDLDDYD